MHIHQNNLVINYKVYASLATAYTFQHCVMYMLLVRYGHCALISE